MNSTEISSSTREAADSGTLGRAGSTHLPTVHKHRQEVEQTWVEMLIFFLHLESGCLNVKSNVETALNFQIKKKKETTIGK